MADETKEALATFLTEGEPDGEILVTELPSNEPPSDIEVPSIAVIAIPAEPLTPTQDIISLVAHLKRIGMAAKDLHYRAKGKAFYGEHLLADLVYDVEKEADDLIEIYFLGATGIEPPRMADVCVQAANLFVDYATNKCYFETGLIDICLKTAKLVEKIKKEYPDLVAGVHAILDSISQKAFVAIGLLDKTIEGADCK